jgi:hypothetical protein
MFSVCRETFIALRARREALRISTQILNPPLDLLALHCRKCGNPLSSATLTSGNTIRCDACCRAVRVHRALAAQIRARQIVLPYEADLRECATSTLVRSRRLATRGELILAFGLLGMVAALSIIFIIAGVVGRSN